MNYDSHIENRVIRNTLPISDSADNIVPGSLFLFSLLSIATPAGGLFDTGDNTLIPGAAAKIARHGFDNFRPPGIGVFRQ
jgi:hypothetical protein